MEERLACGRELIELGDTTGLEVFACVGRQQMAYCYRELGDRDEMDRWCAAARARVHGPDTEQLSYAASIALLDGDLDRAERITTEIEQMWHASGVGSHVHRAGAHGHRRRSRAHGLHRRARPPTPHRRGALRGAHGAGRGAGLRPHRPDRTSTGAARSGPPARLPHDVQRARRRVTDQLLGGDRCPRRERARNRRAGRPDRTPRRAARRRRHPPGRQRRPGPRPTSARVR